MTILALLVLLAASAVLFASSPLYALPAVAGVVIVSNDLRRSRTR